MSASTQWKLIQLLILCIFVWLAHLFWVSYLQPELTTDIAMRQFESTDEHASKLRALRQQQWPVLSGLFVLGVVVIFWGDIKKLWERPKKPFFCSQKKDES